MYFSYRQYLSYARERGVGRPPHSLKSRYPRIWAAREVLFDYFPSVFDWYYSHFLAGKL